MKKITKKKNLSIKKVEVTKLKNPQNIFGGSNFNLGDRINTTKTDPSGVDM